MRDDADFEFLQYYFYFYVGRYEDPRTIANPWLLQQNMPEKKTMGHS